MINSIQDDTGAEITIEDDGTIYIGPPTGRRPRRPGHDQRDRHPHMPEVGERFLGTV